MLSLSLKLRGLIFAFDLRYYNTEEEFFFSRCFNELCWGPPLPKWPPPLVVSWATTATAQQPQLVIRFCLAPFCLPQNAWEWKGFKWLIEIAETWIENTHGEASDHCTRTEELEFHVIWFKMGAKKCEICCAWFIPKGNRSYSGLWVVTRRCQTFERCMIQILHPCIRN